MKKFLLLFTFYILNSEFTSAQNLVPNPSFEEFTSCPYDQCQIYMATGWLPMGYTPDYFNECNGNDFGVPHNVAGYQSAATGNAYAGGVGCDIGIFQSYREYTGIQLLTPLTIGTKYYVSFKVSLADGSNYAINKMGMLFSTVTYEVIPYVCDFDNNTTLFPNNNPQIFTNTIITDTSIWTNISGSFIADSNYKYAIIGNFFDDSNTDYLIVNPDGNIEGSYYFIDDVCVGTDSINALIENNYQKDFVKIYPNPASSKITLQFNEPFKECNVRIYNLFGKSITEHSLLPSENEIILGDIEQGLYYVHLTFDNKSIIQKIIIIKN